MRFIAVLAIFCCSFGGIACLRRRQPTPPISSSSPGDVGEPLFLTPYIEGGRLTEGRAAAEVRLSATNVTSYSGFLTVNKAYNSNLFFWYFPADVDPEGAPVVLWLQGGPGSSSLFGLFCENGPLTSDAEGNIQASNYSWSGPFNMIYIDNPVGAGFSFTNDPQGYATNQIEVGKDLYSALSQFFTLFPDLRKNEFFITGESYAGKYVPAISYTILTNNRKNLTKINLKGLAIGDGFTDPENMLRYGDYLYQVSLIDRNARDVFIQEEAKARECLIQKDYHGANEIIDPLILKIYSPYDSFFTNASGFKDYYNFLDTVDSTASCDSGYRKFLLSDEGRRSVHVGKLSYQSGEDTARYLFDEIMVSVKPWVEELLENYRVLFYNGQLDIICAYPLTVNFLENLSWSGAELYKKAIRKEWMVDGELAGYTKSVKGFTEALVREAGHMVPSDQPQRALDLITKFVFNRPF